MVEKRRRSVIKTALLTLGLILVTTSIVLQMVVGSLAVLFVRDSWLQERHYARAKARCGVDPIVIVKAPELFEPVTDYIVYQPGNPRYNDMKAVNGLGFDGQVYGYYCTLAQAKQAYPGSPDEFDRGY